MLLCCLRHNVHASCHTLRRRLPPSTNFTAYQRLVSSTVHGSSQSLAARIVHSTRWSQILAQNRGFYLPNLHSTPLLGESPSEYCHDVCYGKTRMVWLSDGEKKLKIRLLVLTECTNVTDGQTDGHKHRQTHRHRMTA